MKNPPFQFHLFFLTRRKENVPLTVQKKRRPGEPQRFGLPAPGPYAECLPDGYCTAIIPFIGSAPPLNRKSTQNGCFLRLLDQPNGIVPPASLFLCHSLHCIYFLISPKPRLSYRRRAAAFWVITLSSTEAAPCFWAKSRKRFASALPQPCFRCSSRTYRASSRARGFLCTGEG